MLIIDVTGYLAAGLVLAASCMHSMGALRVLAILSNLAFMAYACDRSLLPILILHAIMLPVNIGRLYQVAHPPSLVVGSRKRPVRLEKARSHNSDILRCQDPHLPSVHPLGSTGSFYSVQARNVPDVVSKSPSFIGLILDSL